MFSRIIVIGLALLIASAIAKEIRNLNYLLSDTVTVVYGDGDVCKIAYTPSPVMSCYKVGDSNGD
jgi:hypothetical protein